MLLWTTTRPPGCAHQGVNASMAYIATDLQLRELCERASKEYDHEKLIDLIKQINDLLDQKQRESDSEEDERQAAPFLATFVLRPRDRGVREWLEYQALVIRLAF